jgi:hypothetical protein
MDKQIYIIHENDEWVVPLREELKKISAPYKEWHIGRDKIDIIHMTLTRIQTIILLLKKKVI